jgi:hypothetical protein
VKAVAQERFVVDSAGIGMLNLDMLLDLREAIELCGGEIAPGIRSEGPGSVAECCDQCFARIARVMSKSVYDAAMAALNASLKASSVQSLCEVISVVKDFTAPFCVVKPMQNVVDVIRGSEVASVAASEASEVDALDRHGSLAESLEFNLGSDLNAVGSEADSPVISLASEEYGEHVDSEGSGVLAEEAGESVDSEGRELDSCVDLQVVSSASEQEKLKAGYGLTQRAPESEQGVVRSSAYPIFSLNMPAVGRMPMGEAESADDLEEGEDVLIKP